MELRSEGWGRSWSTAAPTRSTGDLGSSWGRLPPCVIPAGMLSSTQGCCPTLRRALLPLNFGPWFALSQAMPSTLRALSSSDAPPPSCTELDPELHRPPAHLRGSFVSRRR